MHRAVVIACLPWFVALVASVAVAWLVVRAGGGRWQPRRLVALHTDQVGAVQSLSFVLVLPLFVMVMLFILQLSQVLIGTIVVHYAAYAAARSAIVWVPARLEPYDPQHDGYFDTYGPYLRQNQVGPMLSAIGREPGGTRYLIGSQTPKWQEIRWAAVLACAPVCPSRPTSVSASFGGHPATSLLQAIYARLAPRAAANPQVNVRLRNKLAYSLAATAVRVTFLHKDDEPPLGPYWVRSATGPDLPYLVHTASGPDLEQFYVWEVGWQDPITVTVTHQFALLPGPGRFLSHNVPPPAGGPDRLAQKIRPWRDMYAYPITATVTLGNEGEKSVYPYVEPPPPVYLP